MHPVNLIAKALQKHGKILPELPCEPVEAVCALTGDACLCLPRNEVIGKAFTNLDLFASPKSQFTGVDVFYSWNYGYKTSDDKKIEKKPERMSSWFCDGEQFVELDRQGVREWVLKEKMPAIWTGYTTISYKKHGSVLAKVNTGKQRMWLFETRLVDCDYEKMMDWWQVMNLALRAGISRTSMKTLLCPPFFIAKVGLKIWMEYERWAKAKYQSALYSFLCYLLPSQEELKNEGNSFAYR
ncbi:MAG: hypothetical protein WC623_24070 [Pedobacter sp.]|uniref:hypothetical protein n=1 Tax=Pedobacter sp. TaxID=1411316 RepID=UPI0035642609